MCAYIIEGACVAIFDSWLYLDLELPMVQALKLVNASNTTVLLTWSLPNTSVPVLYYLVSPVGGGGGGVSPHLKVHARVHSAGSRIVPKSPPHATPTESFTQKRSKPRKAKCRALH